MVRKIRGGVLVGAILHAVLQSSYALGHCVDSCSMHVLSSKCLRGRRIRSSFVHALILIHHDDI